MANSRDKNNKQQQSMADPTRPAEPIGFVNTCGNLLLRWITSTSPRAVPPNAAYPGEYCPPIAEINTDKKTAPLSVKYAISHVLRQPTPDSCGDTSAMMVLKFHRDNLKHLLEANNPPLTDAAKEEISQKLKFLDQYSQKVRFSHSRTHPEIIQLYGMSDLVIQTSKSDPLAFAHELAYHLYERGPLSATIKTHPLKISHHEIMVIGIVENHVIYEDCWDGREKKMSIKDFAKKFVDPENAMLRICVDAYSFRMVNTVARVKLDEQAGPKMA